MLPRAKKGKVTLRFINFNGNWKKIKISDIYRKSREKNTKLIFNQYQIISVANMCFNNEKFIKSTNDYMKTYNVMHLGDIAFEGNKSKDFWSGRFVLNDIGDGIVSHVFDVFRPIIKNNLDFMKYYIHNDQVMHPVLLHSTTKTLMMTTLNDNEFLQQKLLLPTLQEQEKIGTFFTKLDKLIELNEQKLNLLKDKKKAYLQKMFC